jgi:para-aminobenzoate synthetase/4-amino-4-deoxychorismate lyase
MSSQDAPLSWTERPCFALLDDATWPERGAILLEKPVEEILVRSPDETDPALLRLDELVASGTPVAGYMAYEFGYCLEPRLRDRLPPTDQPLLRFVAYSRLEVLSARERDRFLASVGDFSTAHIGTAETITEAEYLRRFETVHGLIGAGDVYQVNLTFKIRTDPFAQVSALYLNLRERARASGCALLHFPDEDVLSFSPETFFSARGRQIRVRPMKGTTGRHPVPSVDRRRALDLQADPKQRAENLMIVDLMRNDLSRICEAGSVRVDDLCTVETYPTYHTLTSGITGTLAEDASFARIVPALFPCGSVTGAPKIRAMEIIRETEGEARGVYCGAVGFAAPGRMSFNVAIRTLSLTPKGGTLGIGGGIVWDSEPAGELAEARLKARFFNDAPIPFRLIETMRWTKDGGLHLQARHLARLAASAQHFGFRFDADALLAQITAATKTFEGAWRLRVTLGVRGDTQVETFALEPATGEWPFALSPDRVLSTDWRLYHKTTRREPYEVLDRMRAANPALEEVVLVNERGELTEGCRSTVFIERDGVWLTPPLSCGLLDGCLRREMLDHGPQRTVETVLYPSDLGTGTVWFGNSLRGLIQGRLIAP